MSNVISRIKQDRKMRRLEVGFRSKFTKAKRKASDLSAAQFEAQGNIDVAVISLMHRREIGAILEELYNKTIPPFGEFVVSGFKHAAMYETKQSDEFYKILVARWISEWGLTKADLISDTTIHDIRRVLTVSAENGLGQEETARRLTKMTTIHRIRASVIARTEVHGAANFASLETAKDFEQTTGVMTYKEWIPALDSRTREDHRVMESKKPVPLNDRFRVGQSLMLRPGDPNGAASEVINCRCVMGYVDVEDL